MNQYIIVGIGILLGWIAGFIFGYNIKDWMKGKK